MTRPSFSRRRHRELIKRRKAEAAACAAMHPSDGDVEMTGVDSPSPPHETSDSGSNATDLTEAEAELNFLLQQEMGQSPSTWMAVAECRQEKLRQDLMLEIVEGDAEEGQPKEIALLQVLDELIKLMRGGLQVETAGL